MRELDGARGLAAFAVFLHHVCFTSIGDPRPWGAHYLPFYFAAQRGDAGVDLFFVLSGFLITSLLIEDRHSRAYYHDFYWKRALRILPVATVCLLAVWMLVPHSGRYVLIAAFFLANYATQFHAYVPGPFWSLAVEEQFYLVWPTLIRRRSVAQLTRWAVWIWVGSIGLRAVAACFGHFDYLLTPLRADGLAAGALVACWCAPLDWNIAGLRSRKSWFLAWLAAGLLLVIAAPALSSRAIAWAANCNLTGVTLMCAGTIGLLIAYSGNRWLRPLRWPPLLFLGAISYAFYLTHFYVMMFFDDAVHTPGGNWARFAIRLLVIFGTSVAISVLVRYVIELPAMRLRRFVLSRPTPRPEIEEPVVPHEATAASEPVRS